MSAKAVSEYDGKRILSRYLREKESIQINNKLVSIVSRADHLLTGSELQGVAATGEGSWVAGARVVAKPDMLIKRRGKAGLLCLNAGWEEASKWVLERADREIEVDGVKGVLRRFLVEPFVPHAQAEEHYVCMFSVPEGTKCLFYHEGGVDVGDVDAKALSVVVAPESFLTADRAQKELLVHVKDAARAARLAQFLVSLFRAYTALHFTYLEINPLVLTEDGAVHVLDLAARLDQTAEYLCAPLWEAVTFPSPFGREMTPEEAYIAGLDKSTGSSLKLTVLNPDGKVWTMVAGGGASVVYSDTVADMGFAHELANYGEYSGAPSEAQTFDYAKTLFDLMTRKYRPGKILLIGGGIANFTNVADTFKGIIRAMRLYAAKIREFGIKIYVRRGGPNYQEGLRNMAAVGDELQIPIEVYGPETHMTAIVPIGLGLKPSAKQYGQSVADNEDYTQSVLNSDESRKSGNKKGEQNQPGAASSSDAEDGGGSRSRGASVDAGKQQQQQHKGAPPAPLPWHTLFTRSTTCFIYGMQPRAVQGMLDFDSACRRETPSVKAMIYPFGGNHYQKFYWGTKEVLIPVYQDIAEAVKAHPDVDTCVNFSSFRSVQESCEEILQHPQIRSISIIAEGVPEQITKILNRMAREKGVVIIGPATVGGIKAGCFRIGNTGGMLDNIIGSRLYRPGSVAYVSKSGGMSNELNNIIARNSNGVFEGVAIGGDRYPGSSFLDHILRYEAEPAIHMIVLLGEVGGNEEYLVCEAIKSKRVTKPVVAWCIGTCARNFSSEVQFGHAGALAGSQLETADAKNAALRASGAVVPETFDSLPEAIRSTFRKLVDAGSLVLTPEPPVPRVPIDFNWARELGLVRKPASFISTICDDRGQELTYAGVPITEVFEQDLGIGGVISLLWFKRRLPAYAANYFTMCLILTADHGPAVAGAHNTIVAARAGKDLVSSLCSGLLTIGPRFGGALDGAAEQFIAAYDAGQTPKEFVEATRKSKQLIMGIGHKVKSATNPDMRVTLLKKYARDHFPATPMLDWVLEVEKLTLQKRENLILNVDGCVAALFIDLLRHSGAFTRAEADEYCSIGTLNGLFVLGRTLGFIGHYIDQKRLKQGLYREEVSNILYDVRTNDQI
jgi:ATP citrate (pro-S)-lyase